MQLSRLRVILFTLLLASVALWITNQQTQSLATKPIDKPKSLAYSWQAEDTKIWKLSPQEPNQQTIIEAHNIHYQEQLKKSEFSAPVIQVINNNTLTKLTSKTGESINDNLVSFYGDVKIVQSSIQSSIQSSTQSNQTQSTLKTSSLSYNTKTNQIYSDEKVFITQYNGQTTGTGLRANLNTSEFQILSDVKGTYNPQSMQPIKSKSQ
ncbi:LPS export ABC transporter periplasmic protein LptC [Thiomicrorhabdus sp. Milos-T2]|uniref:LPS export ABC transporter periplasmic protein LptC n=1 Tax=Thiomicrorhabdus sp. Milos-T2 TaxID=90814 RepID=UPI000494A3FF|nr:LPS export ABC transporter periplasmic protein LptC [Thiomicrorhabdus sp. Milos-T2]